MPHTSKEPGVMKSLATAFIPTGVAFMGPMIIMPLVFGSGPLGITLMLVVPAITGSATLGVLFWKLK